MIGRYGSPSRVWPSAGLMLTTPGVGVSPASPPSGVRNNVGTDGAAGTGARALEDAGGVVAGTGGSPRTTVLADNVPDSADAAEPDPAATADVSDLDPLTAL